MDVKMDLASPAMDESPVVPVEEHHSVNDGKFSPFFFAYASTHPDYQALLPL